MNAKAAVSTIERFAATIRILRYAVDQQRETIENLKRKLEVAQNELRAARITLN